MRILANENFPREAVAALRSQGHDVVWSRTELPGAVEEVVLDRARRESHLLLTFDKDFGAMAFRSGLAAPAGVILFRISLASPSYVARTAVSVLQSRTDWAGHFAVVEDDRLRMRSLPKLKAEI